MVIQTSVTTPAAIAYRPTVFDILRERIEHDQQIAPEMKARIYVRSVEIIRQQGLTQI